MTRLHSPLQFGNSDPFDSQSIPIGPHETNILKLYRDYALRNLGGQSWWKVNRVDIVQQICLSDRAAACALLARGCAIHETRCRGQSSATSTTHLAYLTEAQAGLRNNLALVSGPQAPSLIVQVLWTTFFLAYAEMINGSPAAAVVVHIRAMSQLVVQYVELMGEQANKADIVGVVILDMTRACETLSRPTIDMVDWFPLVFRTMWDQTGFRPSGANPSTPEAKLGLGLVHGDIGEERLSSLVVEQREEQERFHGLLDEELDPGEAVFRGLAVHSRQLFQQARILHMIVDAMEQPRTASRRAEEVGEQSARVCLLLSVLLWQTITSPISFTAQRLLDNNGKILQHVRGMMTANRGGGTTLPEIRQGREARLWVLCVGVQTELYRKEVQSFDPSCGPWFAKSFDLETHAMHINSWQEMAAMSEQFLSLERCKPHVSQWWHHVVSDRQVRR